MSKQVWEARGGNRAVADHIAARIADGARRLAFPGGRTPVPILADLSTRPLPWEEITILPTDERNVPLDHPASNVRAIAEALAGTKVRVIPLTMDWTPERFDLVWVGMGSDGHIASIFPSMDIPSGDPPGVMLGKPDPMPPEAPFERLSLNYAALVDTCELIVVARGSEKKILLEKAAAGGNDLPIARLIKAAHCPVRIFWSES